MKAPAKHATLAPFERATDGRLLIGNKNAFELYEIAGKTPCYVYDFGLIEQRVRQLTEQLPKQIHLHYAMKANPNPALVARIAPLVDGLDIASQGELQVALASGMPASHISFAGPSKNDQELSAAIAASITINVESFGELKRIIQIAAQTGTKAKVCLRLNPDFSLKSAGMQMGGGAKPFGIDVEQLVNLAAILPSEHVEFRGLHIYSGSQNLKSESIVEAQNATFALALRVCEEYLAPLGLTAEKINIGGGFGIPYFPGNAHLALEPIMNNLERLVQQYHEKLNHCRFELELGRYLVGEAGIYICEIIDRKTSRDVTFLCTNGGLHHHLSNSGNFGQVLRKNYPVELVKRNNAAEHIEPEKVSVVGPLCTPLDIVAEKVELPPAQIGDLLVIFHSGAYGFSASPHLFLGHKKPVELLF